MKHNTTQTITRRLLPPLVFLISVLLSTQALAFDVDGLGYAVIGATEVKVLGRTMDNTATDIVIPDTVVDSGTTYSVTSIQKKAFQCCALPSLTSVTIGNNVTTIGDFAFLQNALTSVIIPDSVTTIGYGAFLSNPLSSVIIGNSVTTIGNFAFRGTTTTAITSLIIGNSVATIGASAFLDNDLTSVIIPDSVTTIGDYAFRRNRLTSVAFEGNFDAFDTSIFGENFDLATITYCDGTTGWPQGFNTGATIITTTPVACFTPDAPTIDSIEAGDGQVTVTFTPGADNGSPVTGYRYIKDDVSFSSTILATDGEVGQIAPDAAGNVYFTSIDYVCDNDGLCIGTSNVRKIAPDGTSTIFSINDGYVGQIALDAAGNIYFNSYDYSIGTSNVWKIAPDGTSTALLEIPGSLGIGGQIALDAAGNVYTAVNGCTHVDNSDPPQCNLSSNVWKVTPDGVSAVLSTTDGFVREIAIDAAGNVYGASSESICDNDGGCIQTSNVWRITPDGTPTILLTTDGNVGQIALDAAGNVYVASSVSVLDSDGCNSSNTLWKITASGIPAIFENSDCIYLSGAINIVGLDTGGNLYIRIRVFGFPGSNVIPEDTISKITPDGTSTIYGSFDTNVSFLSFESIVLDAAGNFYAASNDQVCDNDGLCIPEGNLWQFTPASIATYPANGESSPITIAGLSRGTDYLISLIAVNAAGESVASNPVSISIPSTAPDAPTNLTAVSAPEQAVILFDAGASNGSAITNYQYSLNGGAYTALSPANSVSPITIPGLTNGTDYSIRLKAINSIGDSVASNSVAVTLPAVIGNNITLSSTIDVIDAASFITGSIVGVGNFYPDETLSIATVTSISTSFGDADIISVTTYYGDIAQNIFTSNGTTSQQTLSCTGPDTICNYYIIGVASGTSPVFSADICSGLPGSWQTVISSPATVITDNVLTASSSGGPDCLALAPPLRPEITAIDPGNAQVSISVSVADDGGSPITGYSGACISEGGNSNGMSPTSPITVTGLTNGQSYVCIVYATNAIGNSPLSSASAAFAPVAPPFGC